MKTSIKVFLVSLLVIGVMKFKASADWGIPGAGQAPDGLSYVTATSSGVMLQRGAVIYGIYSSTGDGRTDWYQLFDTATLTGGGTAGGGFPYNAFSATNAVIPATFMTVSTVNATIPQNQVGFAWNFMPYGVNIVNGLYVYFGSVPNGVAGFGTRQSVTVLYRK